MIWTKEKLKEKIKKQTENCLLVIASNREPYIHSFKEGKIIVKRPTGGAVTALDPVMKACEGTWVAHGSGTADRQTVDEKNRIKVPPQDPSYTLRRVWLTKEEEEGYYYGYSNQALWPLCHIVYQRPIFDAGQWESYKKVNRVFADAILEEIGNQKAVLWLQDYHLALAAKYVKEKRPDVFCAQFWHIPWPNPEAFRICPQRKEILEGLLANDLLGFHIRYHCENFIATVEREIEAKTDKEKTAIVTKGHETVIRAFPISVDFEDIGRKADSEKIQQDMARLKSSIIPESKLLFLGLDRLDYTKGIPERFLAIDRFLEKYPQYKEKFVLFQVGALSRIHIPSYKNLNEKLNAIVEEINWKHSTPQWSPIMLMREHITYDEILACYKLADVCIVSALHDGMNLVAKEYISAKTDNSGVLLLSNFTGSARELTDAVYINPYDIENFADTLKEAIEMPEEEKIKRMMNLRKIVRENNIYKWASKVFEEIESSGVSGFGT
ncbi:MAG: trehalose-6-phosphate synthase [Candidatus Omnitrophota bacterium]